MKPKFFGKVSKGRIILDEPDTYRDYIFTLDDKRIELTVQKEQKDKSLPQTKYLFGIIYKAISETTGYTIEEVHQMMKSIFLKTHKEVAKKRYTVIRSISELTTVEMSEYIENCKRWGATELQLNIPESNKFNE